MGAWGYHSHENDPVGDAFIDVIDGIKTPIDEKKGTNRHVAIRLDKLEDNVFVGCLISLIGKITDWKDEQWFPMGHVGMPKRVPKGVLFDRHIERAVRIIDADLDELHLNKQTWKDVNKRREALMTEKRFFKAI
jgi:hypothetical protein